MSLWQTDDTRTYRPSVLDEVRNGLFEQGRRLVFATPALSRYLHTATPLDQIERLNIGSRPSRRTGNG